MQHEWRSFLNDQGAQWDGHRLQGFESAIPPSLPDQFMTPMTEHALVVARGANTHQFLQGQLSCDMREVARHRHLTGTHCTAQGRMISSWQVFQLTDDAVALRLPLDNLDAAVAALKKYAAFSRVTLEPSSWQGLFLSPPHTAENLPSPDHCEADENHLVARHNDGSIEAWGDTDSLIALWQQFGESHTPTGAPALQFWQIQQGLAEVHSATSGEFIPQQFNYDLIGAISFGKGCYTGQEVIARVHYRGQTKKRTRPAQVEPTEAQFALGDQVQLAGKTVGTIVAQADGYGKRAALVCIGNHALAADTGYRIDNQEVNFLWNKAPYAIPNE